MEKSWKSHGNSLLDFCGNPDTMSSGKSLKLLCVCMLVGIAVMSCIDCAEVGYVV